jgi:sugar phosphate isomerase/epimerase
MNHRTGRRDFLKVSIGGALGAAVSARPARGAASVDLAQRLAVCSWSLQPTSAQDLLSKLAATGLSRVQIALDPIRTNAGGAWSNFSAQCAKRGVTLVSGMLATVGEDYTTLESIRKTGGVVPDATWPETWRSIQANAGVALKLNIRLVTFHAGFLPHEPSDPMFVKLVGRIRQVADLYAVQGVSVALETGQESAATMAAFLKQVGRKNVGVNLDPANMILYDQGDPVEAVKALGPWIRQCHVKDAVRTKKPGTWGEEVPVGTGQVDWKAFFAALDAVRFTGPLAIEREAGRQRVADIRTAKQFVERIVGAG